MGNHPQKQLNAINSKTAGVSLAPAPAFSAEKLKSLSLEVLIDEFGPLDEEVRRFKPTKDKHEAYRKEIERRANEAYAKDASVTLPGLALYDVAVGPRANEREITDPAKAFDVMRKFAGTLDKFKALCRFKLEDIDSFPIPLKILDSFLKKDRTGRRSVDAVRKADTPKAEAA